MTHSPRITSGIPLLRERLKDLPPERLSVIDEALTDLLDILDAGQGAGTG